MGLLGGGGARSNGVWVRRVDGRGVAGSGPVGRLVRWLRLPAALQLTVKNGQCWGRARSVRVPPRCLAGWGILNTVSAHVDADLPDWGSLAGTRTFSTLLLGNGFSQNIWPAFGYSSLKSCATISRKSEAVFSAIGTTNFEEVLRGLAQARVVLKAVGKKTKYLRDVYKDVRSGLFGAIGTSHLLHGDLSDTAAIVVAKHLNSYERVFTLNYDLLLYWSHMLALSSGENVNVGDFMWASDMFDPDDTDLFSGRTGIYYLHGGLHLWQDRTTGEVGKWTHDGLDILTQARRTYTIASHKQPLFVSEGASSSKLRAIRRSEYLSFAYGALEDDEKDSIVFGTEIVPEYDDHIARALDRGAPRTIAFSVFRGTRTPEEVVTVKAKLNQRFRRHTLLFFDSATHPLGDPSLRISARP